MAYYVIFHISFLCTCLPEILLISDKVVEAWCGVGYVGGGRAASCAGIGRASRLTAPTRGRLLLHRVQGRVSSVAPDTTGYLDIYTTRYLHN